MAADTNVEDFVPDGVDQVKPGTVLPADYPWPGAPLPEGDMHAAVPGNDQSQSQRSDPAENEAARATKRVS